MKTRLVAVFFASAMLFGGLYARLLYLSQQSPLAAAAKSQTSVSLTVSHTRAGIYDCKMTHIVNKGSTRMAAVFPLPENMAAVKTAAGEQYTEDELMEFYSESRPFTISVDEDFSAEGVLFFDVPERYQDEQTAAHIVGCVDSDGSGSSGIESSYDDFLDGHAVEQTVSYSVNGTGELLKGESASISSSGEKNAGVVLTIDSAVQSIVESVGKRYIDNGAVVVMDPKTGDIKAMASFPSFSQNALEKSVKDTENTPMINRALSAYAVGSTFKICTAAAALESGISEIWYKCTGKIDVNGQEFSCHEQGGHGTLSMKLAMANSCNTYFIKLGLMLDRAKFRNTAADMSFGKSYRLAASITSDAGTLPSQSELGNSAEVANLAFGQGKLAAIPLQVTLMTCCVINGGQLVYPRLVMGTTTDGKALEENEAKAPMNVLSESTAQTIKEFLDYDVMNTENQYARPLTVSAGGKTATAQTGVFENGVEKLNTWFTGYFPAEDPQYAVTVLCENGTWGNTSAAPVFQKIADRVTALEEEENDAD